MKILITGSEGVLGSTLKKTLRDRGYDVYGCDLTHSNDPKVTRADISERRQIARVFEKVDPDLVYNFAAEFGRNNGQDFYEQLWKSNCLGTRNVIEECVKHGSQLAHASSSEAYGLAENYTKEDLHEGLLDRFPPQFHNEYALTKWTNERQIAMASRNDNLNAVIFRFFNVYGPPERYSPYRSVICQFAYKLLAGEPITLTKDGFRSHLWIGDWAQAVANLAEERDTLAFNSIWSGASGEPYLPVFNIGGDVYESIETVYNKLVKIIKPVNPIVTYVDSEKANCAAKRPNNDLSKIWLGYKTTVYLDEGLERTVEFLRRTYGF